MSYFICIYTPSTGPGLEWGGVMRITPQLTFTQSNAHPQAVSLDINYFPDIQSGFGRTGRIRAVLEQGVFAFVSRDAPGEIAFPNGNIVWRFTGDVAPIISSAVGAVDHINGAGRSYRDWSLDLDSL